jgi:GNAT superfamily N-acetyltransferase
MPRDTGRNDRRSRIAYLAARLMAEDGIEDYALAKRKAARQAGEPDTRELPANEEIDEALRTYQQIYHREAHRNRWRGLLETAVRAMRELARFNPYLTGSVLNGNAGKYADVNLQLFTDNEKAVELYLIDRAIPYRAAQSRLYAGEEMRTVPVYTISDQGTDIELTVLSVLDLRGPLKTSPEGKSIERAKLQVVEQLLAEA